MVHCVQLIKNRKTGLDLLYRKTNRWVSECLDNPVMRQVLSSEAMITIFIVLSINR
jgi:hypothetical protein